MVQWFLKSNGHVVPRRTLRKLTTDEIVRDSEVKKRADFTEAINQRYGDSICLPASRRPNTKYSGETYDLTFDQVDHKFPEADILDDE